jgi:hypothetical protein
MKSAHLRRGLLRPRLTGQACRRAALLRAAAGVLPPVASRNSRVVLELRLCLLNPMTGDTALLPPLSDPAATGPGATRAPCSPATTTTRSSARLSSSSACSSCTTAAASRRSAPTRWTPAGGGAVARPQDPRAPAARAGPGRRAPRQRGILAAPAVGARRTPSPGRSPCRPTASRGRTTMRGACV